MSTDVGSVAFSRFVPFARKRSRATPPVFVFFPPTFAPATGLFV